MANNGYFIGFDDKEDIAEEFSDYGETGEKEKKEILEDLKGAKILFAVYGGAAYEGDVTIIYRKNKKLFEVQGSHCSCYGLEGQWGPEEISVAGLKQRPGLCSYSHDKEACEAFDLMRSKLRESKK